MTALAIHGGAGLDPNRSYAREQHHLLEVATAARVKLVLGATAVEVAVETVQILEASGLYVAGRGASPNTAGIFELDASVMDGATGRAGAVAALVGFKSPIAAARAVMTETPHVLLAGLGAGAFAGTHGLEPIEDPDAWFTPAGLGELIGPVGSQHGTVGCVALDAKGRLASAASTGGTFGKRPGRVGDTPIVGAGIWADEGVAVACTGLGEYFQRTAAAARVAHRVSFSGLSVSAATQDAMSRIAGLGGTGAIIALGAGGDISLKYLGAGLKCAVAWPDGRVSAHILPAPLDTDADRRAPVEGAGGHLADTSD